MRRHWVKDNNNMLELINPSFDFGKWKMGQFKFCQLRPNHSVN